MGSIGKVIAGLVVAALVVAVVLVTLVFKNLDDIIHKYLGPLTCPVFYRNRRE